MIIGISRPSRHPQTGVFYYRARLPAELLPTHRGSSITLGNIIKVSLRTKENGEARLRHTSVQSQLEQRWASAKGKTIRLTKIEISGLVGIWYRDLVLTHQDDAGNVEGWEGHWEGNSSSHRSDIAPPGSLAALRQSR